MSDRQEGPGWWLASDARWYPPESHPSVSKGAARPSDSLYAGFWLRAGAWLIDGVIFIVAFTVAAGALGSDDESVSITTFLVLMLAFWLYFALMESSSRQATLGKRALSIKVTDTNGDRISFGRASGRHFAKGISGVAFYIGFLMAGFTERKQALHDFIASTLVVKV